MGELRGLVAMGTSRGRERLSLGDLRPIALMGEYGFSTMQVTTQVSRDNYWFVSILSKKLRRHSISAIRP